jgi:hypothetical protein
MQLNTISSLPPMQLNTISSPLPMQVMRILHQRQQWDWDWDWHLELNPIQIHQVDEDDVVDDVVDDDVDDNDVPDLLVVYNVNFWADNKVINGG